LAVEVDLALTAAILNSHDPVACDGRESKRRVVREEQPQQGQSQLVFGMGGDDDDDEEEDDNGAETICSRATVDAARAKANELLNQSEAATFHKSSAPLMWALQQAVGMGPHGDNNLWNPTCIGPIWCSRTTQILFHVQ